MALYVWTAQLPHHRVPGYDGPGALNVTRGSGGAYGGAFAPSRLLLDEANARKRQAKGNEAELEALWAWYAPLYVVEMRLSWMNDRAKWVALLRRTGEVTLCCYCRTWRRCHRRLLVDLLLAAGRHLGLEVIDCGERDAWRPDAAVR